MDLIYMNSAKEDEGVMKDFTLDLAFGKDENDFECKIISSNHCCEEDFYLYVEHTEYGGIIDDIGVDTDNDEITYYGRTWHGIMNSKVIEPLKATDANSGGVAVTCGKNLIPYPYYNTTSVSNGVTFTDNGDGSITASGTSDSASHSYFNFRARLETETELWLEPGTYIVSGCPSGGGTGIYRLWVGTVDKNGVATYKTADIGNGSTFSLTEKTKIAMNIQVFHGATVSNLTFYPMLRSADIEDDAYEPYTEHNTIDEYLILTGEANNVLQWLIDRMKLSDLFVSSEVISGITISNYQMDRYIGGYDGIKKMLKAYGAKLHLSFKNGFVELSAKPIVDYSKDDQFDTDQINFNIKKKGNPINHVICLGKGDLAEREVIHLYADKSGNISTTQSLTGIKEVEAVYDYSSAESSEELRKGGIELIQESWNSDEIKFGFESDAESYDVGDVVGAKEQVTGIEVSAEIIKKIVTINNNSTTISYEVGEQL